MICLGIIWNIVFMQRIRTSLLIAAIAMVLMAGVLLLLAKGSGNSTSIVTPSSSASKAPSAVETPKATSSGSEKSKAGDKSGDTGGEESKPAETKVPGLQTQPQNFGRAKTVNAKENAQAASVAEALKTGTHPERLAALLPSKERYDKLAFRTDPQKTLRIVEPGRVFQVSQPGPDVPALTAVSDRLVEVKQGDTVKLSVKGVPLSLVSFTSFDMGSFSASKLTSASVQADKDGIATVNFSADAGTLNDVNILAGSPESSGTVKFVVNVEETSPVKN